jgi:HK97 family phage major capsid protein
MEPKLSELRAKRADVLDKAKVLVEKDHKAFTAEDQKALDALNTEADGLLKQIENTKAHQERMASSAQPAAGQEDKAKVHATVETDRYVKDKSLVVGGICKMLGLGGGSIYSARQASADVYGAEHPVTKALITGVGPAGGFIIPPDYMNEIIELLRPATVVRSAGPRTIPMPRGTMTIPGQASAASANYGSEVKPIGSSQQSLNSIVASYKKLTALVPVSNDMMRYADPAVDAFVRDDLVKVMALREDLAFLLGDGTADAPRGYTSFASGFATSPAGGSGVAGSWLSNANSTAATQGQFITSNPTFTLSTVASELAGLIQKLDGQNVSDIKRAWFMNPRTKNFLYNVQNSLGEYVYAPEMDKGRLRNYPFRTTTQIPTNIWDTTGTNKDCSFLILAEMDESMIFDSMQLELFVSREGSYVDTNGNTVSAVQNDQTIIRAIAEHDFQLRHDASVAIGQFVRWAPASS